MAVPLLLAPIAGFVGAITTKLFDGLISLFAKKFVLNAALIIAFLASYGVLTLAVNGLLSSFTVGQIPSVLASGFSMLPTNTDNVITIAISIKGAVLVFRLQTNIIWLKKV